MHHGQELLTRMRSIRSRKAYYEQLERVNRESDEDRKVQTRRTNLDGTRMETTVDTLSGYDGKTQGISGVVNQECRGSTLSSKLRAQTLMR